MGAGEDEDLFSQDFVGDLPTGRSRALVAHFALAGSQAIFGAGTVVAQVTLDGVNPVVFALIREGVAGPLLILLSRLIAPRVSIEWRHWWRFAITGVALFCNNFLYIVGVKIAGSTTTAIWQPVQPITILMMGVALGHERFTWVKFGGIVLAVSGCIFYSAYDVGSSSDSASNNQLVGNLLLCGQCFAVSAFYVSQKPMFRYYPPIMVLAWSYMIATVLMTIAAVIVNTSPALLDTLCPGCNGYGWGVSSEALIGIGYWVFLGSIVGYFLASWGNQYVDTSIVGIYSVIQPVVTTLVALVVIALTAAPHYGLSGLNMGQLGAVAIFIGLCITVYDNNVHGQSIILLPTGRSIIVLNPSQCSSPPQASATSTSLVASA